MAAAVTDLAERTRWVSRVLGIVPGDAVSPSRGVETPLQPIWADAADKATGELEQLQAAIRAMRTPTAAVVARKGIGGLIRRIRDGVGPSLVALDEAPVDKRAKMIEDARRGVSEMRAFVGSHPALPMLERNSFGIAVGVRATLSHALDELDKALAT
jgi:hypothetical protein